MMTISLCGLVIAMNDDQCGWTPLNTATYKGHAAVVIHLVEAGANIDQANEVIS